MKTISIVVPCYNEEENVQAMADALRETFKKDLPAYRYEVLFIDNDSKDRTREIIRKLCAEDKGIKGIFNAKNFGQFNSPYYAMLQTTGDATVLMAADFQDPVEMIPRYVKEWENGYKIVIGIKKSSQENKLMYWLRGCYYKLIKKLSDVEQIEQFTGFGLYDKKFINVMRELNDPTPFLRGIVAELGFKRKEIPYEQPKRRAGKTSNNFYRLYDAAMLSITSYTKVGLRLATFIGMTVGCISLVVAIIYLILKLLFWDNFPAGMAPLLIVTCLLGSIQLFFIGLIGEYIMSINDRVKKRPLVVEDERLNFLDEKEKENEADENASDRVNGVECARILSNINPDLKIIFVTAHSEYMSNAFDIYAYDYIVKPFDIQRVERTLRRIAASGENVTSSDNTGKVKSSPGRKMMIRGRESTNFIDIDEIVMVERQGKSTIIHTIRDEYNTSMGLGDIEEKLTDSKFIRSHKSFIINMDYVSRIEPYGRWTYIVKFNGKDYDALITSSKYDEIKKIYG